MLSFKHLATALSIAAALTVTSAQAGIVDLRGLAGNFDQGTWGHQDTTLYAQSVIADDVFFSEFRFAATTSGNVPFNLVISGDRADGGGGLGFAPDFNDIRFSAAGLVIGGAGQTEFTFSPNIAVTAGERLFITMDTATILAAGNGSIRATAFNGTEQYVPGEFVFLNAGTGHANLQVAAINGAAWSHRSGNNEDLAIRAVFTGNAVPEPGTLALLGMGFAAAGFSRRRARA